MVGASLVSGNGSRDHSGMVFPYTQPWDHSRKPVLYVLRRDHPDLETVDGMVKEKGKYLVATGIQRLYFLSWVLSLPVLPIEGERRRWLRRGSLGTSRP